MGSFFTLKRFLIFVALPYLVGFFLSQNNLPLVQQILSPVLNQLSSVFRTTPNARVVGEPKNNAKSRGFNAEKCYASLRKEIGKSSSVLADPLPTVVHRNGEADACGTTTMKDLDTELQLVLQEMSEQEGVASCPAFEKYQVESVLTRLVHRLMASSCSSQETDDRAPTEGFYGFCDMGPDRTPILLDHKKLVPVHWKGNSYLPCHFHDAFGVRVTSLSQLWRLAAAAAAEQEEPEEECRETTIDGESVETTCAATTTTRDELHLYAVPAGRVFLHTPSHVGQIIPLPHVQGADPSLPVYLEVLSVRPAVFDVHNFFTRSESDNLVERALAETKDSHKMKRSSTGPEGYTINQRRTSENGFDTDGPTSVAVKRCVSLFHYSSCSIIDNYVVAYTESFVLFADAALMCWDSTSTLKVTPTDCRFSDTI